ncbi:MAG: ATP-binding protein [Pseudomonadota bacterium]
MPEPKSKSQFERTLRPDPLEVRATLVALRQELSPSVDDDSIDTIELICAEILNNVVEHAFADPMPDDGTIRVRTDMRDGALTFNVVDNGHPMPGGEPPNPDAPEVDNVAQEALPEGGFGWNLIHHLSGGLSYHHADGCNHLSVWIEV